MKHSLLFLLFALITIPVFSQGEFVIEKYNGTKDVFFKSKGCTPEDGVIVFYTEIFNLKFSMPDTPKRLRHISAFDNEKNCYVLCIQPTDQEIGGITKYSIDIAAEGYIPITLDVKGINVGETQYFTINSKNDSVKVENEKLKSQQAELIKKLEEKQPQNPIIISNQTPQETNKQSSQRLMPMELKQSKVAWGIRLGYVNYTEKVTASDESGSASFPGFELGPIFNYSFNKNLYINSGAMFGIITPGYNDDVYGDYHYYIDYDDNDNYYYANIPIYLGLKIPFNNNGFSLFTQLGPYIEYWLTSSNSVKDEWTNHCQYGWALMASIGYKLKFEFGYRSAFTNMMVNEEGEYGGNYYQKSSSKLSAIIIGFSYVF